LTCRGHNGRPSRGHHNKVISVSGLTRGVTYRVFGMSLVLLLLLLLLVLLLLLLLLQPLVLPWLLDGIGEAIHMV
jgi:hypothetical protein